MKPELILPTVLIIINALAAVVFFFAGDKMRAGYFASAAMITYFAGF